MNLPKLLLCCAIGSTGLMSAQEASVKSAQEAPAKSAQETGQWLCDSMPQAWQMTPQSSQTLPADDQWWHTFKDPVLDRLISLAVANNYNVAAAIKRIDMARKSIRETEAGYFPTISLNGGWSRTQEAGAMSSPVGPSEKSSGFSLGATMNWEIDVFGRVRTAAKAKKAAYQATRADYDAVLVSLCAELATAYMQLRTCQKQLAVAQAHIKLQERVVKITEARYEADLGNMLDVTQARTVLFNTQSSLPSLRGEIKTLVNSIAILTGEYPSQLGLDLAEEKPLPTYRCMVNTGVPSDLLRRRPDIVEAEMTLGEYAAQIGVAKKDFLPTLSFTGTIGTAAHNAGDLFGEHSLSYSVAPQLSWTLFDGLARNYRTAEAKLQFEAAIDTYNLTVMNAVEEVDNALINYDSTLEGIELQQKVVTESEKALNLAIELYTSGLTAFSNVVDGQMNWLESENSLVVLEGKALSTLITLYKALGGGWESPDNDLDYKLN